MLRKTAAAALLLLVILSGIAPAWGSSPQIIQPIYDGPEMDYQPAMIRIQASGQLMVVFERWAQPAPVYASDLWVTFSDDNGQTWTAPQVAVGSAQSEMHPALLQLDTNAFVLFYLVDETGYPNSSYRLHRATSSDGQTWTDQGALDLGWPTSGEINPNVVHEADGTLTMTYQRSGAGYIARSTDDGATWDTLRTLVNSSARLPRLAKRESDGLYVVSYQKSIGGYDMGIYAQASYDPYDWNVPEGAISDQVDSHDSQPIVLEDGTLAIFYASRPSSYYDLFYRTSSDGANWSVPVQLTNNPARYDTQPHPLRHGTPGHVILVWPHQDDNNPTPYEDHDVWVNTDVTFVPDLSVSAKNVTPAVVAPAGLLTYTLFLDNSGHRSTAAWLSDPLPTHTAYAGGLWASSGSYGYDAGHDVITWTGAISTVSQVTVTFVLSTTLDLGDGEVVTNTAVLTDGEGLVYPLAATAIGDALPPASAITDPLEGQIISSTSYLVHGVAADTVSSISAVSVSVDGGPWEMAAGGASWAYSWSGFADGPHNLRSQAVDAVGHVESPGPGVTVTVDTTPPEVVAHLPPAGAVEVPLSATVVVTFSEAIVTETLAYTCPPDPGGWSASWNAERTSVALVHDAFAYGQTYTFTLLQARDGARNALVPVEWSFTAAPPCAGPAGVDFVHAPAEPLVQATVYFSGSVLSGTAPFTYSWDFGDGGTAEGPHVSHSFGRAGTYTTTLTVSNACGEASRQHLILVAAYRIYLPLIVR